MNSRILSGIRPTGSIHIGNYLGSLKQWTELSHEPDTDCFFMIADYHALLSFRETPLNKSSYDLLSWQLAAGLNPNSVTLFVQSQVPAHTELAWIFNALVTVPELGRMTQYKDLISLGTEKPNAALFVYPTLQAADILLYKATVVPVGEDQVQHVEFTRTIARRANQVTQTQIFPQPKARLTESSRLMSLDDPTKKMAKSMPQGALLLEDDEAILRQKISRAVTDTGPSTELPDTILKSAPLTEDEITLLLEHMSPGVKNLFILLRQTVTDTSIAATLFENYKDGTLQYRELKQATADAVVNFIMPLQEKYKEFRSDETKLKAILSKGANQANQVANTTLAEAKEAFKLLPN
jgi:tryptophanyl-tRNA synthetase